jgi:hypothetical protein
MNRSPAAVAVAVVAVAAVTVVADVAMAEAAAVTVVVAVAVAAAAGIAAETSLGRLWESHSLHRSGPSIPSSFSHRHAQAV